MMVRKKKAYFKDWLPSSRKNISETERLKVFLDSAPGEYFGWSRDSDMILYSPGFTRLFGAESFSSHDDIQNTLEPFDAASFEAILTRYKKDPRPQELTVQTYNGRHIELSFRWGECGTLHYHVIWARDITHTHKAQQKTQEDITHLNKDIKELQNIVDSLPQPIWTRNASGALSWCNKAYEDLFEKTRQEILDEQKNILVKPVGSKTKTDSKHIALKALKTGETQTLEGHGILKGERQSLHIQEKPSPPLDMTIGCLENLTWKEEIESRSERNMNVYRTIFGSLQTAVALYNSERDLTYYNTAFAQLWQLDEAFLNQRPKLEDVLEKLRETRRLPEQTDFKSYKQSWIDMFTNLIDPHSDIMVLPDGTVLRTQIIPHPAGGLGHVFEDVTSNLELESSYNTLMAVQKETIDNLAEGVVVYGSDGRLKLWNQTFSTMWGFHPEDLDGQPHITSMLSQESSNKDQWDNQKQQTLNMLEDRQQDSGLIKHHDGRVLNFSSVLLPDGALMLTYADVTDSIRVEGALREKNTALETAERLKTDFLKKISYQLRTPLSTMIGFNDILDQEYFGTLNTKQKEYTSGIEDAGRSLKTLIDDILDLTSIEAGMLTLETEKTALLPLLTAVKDATQDWADQKQIKLTLKCPKTIGNLNIDPKRMRHCLKQLIQNAISFTPEKGSVTLSARKQKGHILIAVQDTGDGIPADELDHIFKPFGQNHVQGGAGLGLTLVKNIMELHHGTIDIKTFVGTGTTITLSFPLN